MAATENNPLPRVGKFLPSAVYIILAETGFCQSFYQDLLSAAVSYTNPLSFYRTDSNGTPLAKYSPRTNTGIR